MLIDHITTAVFQIITTSIYFNSLPHHVTFIVMIIPPQLVTSLTFKF